MIDTATNTVSATIPVGKLPFGLSVTPDGSKVYVVNEFPGIVQVIDTATNTVSATIPVGNFPLAWGIFIKPAPRFAGVPGSNNCHGTSVSVLAIKFGGLDAAAAALRFSTVQGLQDAIRAFALLINPDAVVEKLKRWGGVIPGIDLGPATADHIDHVRSRITILGAVYLAVVSLVPEILISYAGIPIYLGGVPALVVVCTVLDIHHQVQAHREERHQ